MKIKDVDYSNKFHFVPLLNFFGKLLTGLLVK